VIAVVAERMVFSRSVSWFAMLECDWCKVANTMRHHKLLIPIASPSFHTHHLASSKIRIWVLGCNTAVSIKWWWLLNGMGFGMMDQIRQAGIRAILLLNMVETLVGGQSNEGSGLGLCSVCLGMHWVGMDGMTALVSAGVVVCVVALYTYYATLGFLFGFAIWTDCWSNGGWAAYCGGFFIWKGELGLWFCQGNVVTDPDDVMLAGLATGTCLLCWE